RMHQFLRPLQSTPMISISLTVDRFQPVPVAEHATAMACPRCHACLLIHQPDQHLPDRLLATCDECRTWFLIHAAVGVILRLPNEEDLEGAPSTALGRFRSGLLGRSAASPGSRR